MKTYSAKPGEIEHRWFVVDANAQTLGRLATEVADYSKKSFEEGILAFEQLLGAKSVEKAIELQLVYFKNAYEGFVTQATKIGALYADLVKETCKPFEGYGAKITPAK